MSESTCTLTLQSCDCLQVVQLAFGFIAVARFISSTWKAIRMQCAELATSKIGCDVLSNAVRVRVETVFYMCTQKWGGPFALRPWAYGRIYRDSKRFAQTVVSFLVSIALAIVSIAFVCNRGTCDFDFRRPARPGLKVRTGSRRLLSSRVGIGDDRMGTRFAKSLIFVSRAIRLIADADLCCAGSLWLSNRTSRPCDRFRPPDLHPRKSALIFD